MKPRILITVSNGHTGLPAAQELLSLGLHARPFGRNLNKPQAKELRKLGAELFVGDIEAIRDARNSLEGVQRAHNARRQK